VTAATPSGTRQSGRVTLSGVHRSEFRKLFGLRSTWWLLGVGLVVPPIFSAAQIVNQTPETPSQGVFDAVTQSTGASLFSMLIVSIVLGTLTATSEFETRSMTVTMAAVPSRTPVVLAKVGVVLIVTTVVGFSATLLAYSVGVALRGDTALFLDRYALRAVAGTAFYEGCVAVIAVSIAFLIRSTVGSIAVTFAFLYILPVIIHAIPLNIARLFADTIPGTSAEPLFSALPDPGGFGVAGAVTCVTLWTIVAVVVAAVTTRRRDI
jgi:ABC-2 type transport system permease protein